MHSELLALGSAVALALGSMFMSELKGRLDAFSVTRWSMVVATLMTGAAAAVVGGWTTITTTDLIFLTVSGFFAISVAGPGYYGGIFSIGARNTLLIFSLNAPIAGLAGFMLFGETFALKELAGLGLILAGVAFAVLFGERAPPVPLPLQRCGGGRMAATPGRPRRAVLSLDGYQVWLSWRPSARASPMWRRNPRWPMPSNPSRPWRSGPRPAGSFSFCCCCCRFRALAPHGSADGRSLTLILTGTGIGMGIGMTMLMAALADGEVGIVSTLSSMTPVAVLPMVWARTGVAPPWPAWMGAAVAVAGTAVLFGSGCLGNLVCFD